MSDVYPTNPSIGTTANGRIWDGSRWNCPALLIDAPADGNTYGRMNNTWQQVLPANGGELLNLLIDYDLSVMGKATVQGLFYAGGGIETPQTLYAGNGLEVIGTGSVSGTLQVGGLATFGAAGVVDQGFLVVSGGVMSYPAGATNSFGFWQGSGTNVMEFGFGAPNGNPTNGVAQLDINGNLGILGTLSQGSDERLKEYIGEYVGGLEIVKQLQPRHYHWKKRATHRQIGLIAQEVSKELPEAVSESLGIMGIEPMALIAVLINAVKELERKHEQLVQQINRLINHGDPGRR